MSSGSAAGVGAFIAGLRRCGVDAEVNGSVVTFTVEAPGPPGPTATLTGVAVAELQAWPAVPPHWIHLPQEIRLAATNINQAETLPGWVRHSRQVNGWGDAEEPAQAWLAHLRRILLEAQ